MCWLSRCGKGATVISMKRCFLWRHLPLIVTSCALHGQLNAGTIFQSASPPASQFPAEAVANTSFAQQASGVLFQITQTTQIDSIGVWVFHNNTTPQGLFGEIVSVSGFGAFPVTDPYSSAGLGRVYFA